MSQSFNVSSSGLWYDLTAAVVASSACALGGPQPFSRRFLGHMEGFGVTTSDPAMAVGGSLFAKVPCVCFVRAVCMRLCVLCVCGVTLLLVADVVGI